MTELKLKILSYEVPGFKDWVERNGFSLINKENERHYFGVFSMEEKCTTKACETCAGYKPTYKDEEALATGQIVPQRCQEKLQRALKTECQRLLKAAEIPARYKDCKMSDLSLPTSVSEQVIEYVNQFPKNTPPGLYLYSTHNTGKTSVLWIMVKSLLTRNKLRSFILRSTPLFMNDLRKAEFDGEGENALLRKACTCGLVMFDDFGAQRPTKASQDWIFTIIDYRVNNLLPTIFASNFAPDPVEWNLPTEQTLIHRILPATKILCFDKDDNQSVKTN
jgi:DNA replication protein DnaC